jgi:hypothetical protein
LQQAATHLFEQLLPCNVVSSWTARLRSVMQSQRDCVSGCGKTLYWVEKLCGAFGGGKSE